VEEFMTSALKIPVLSFFGTSAADFAQRFGRALEEFGFVSLVDHGIDVGLIAKLYEESLKVFDLPVEVKMKYAIVDTGFETGYRPFGCEKARGSQNPDLKEFWQIRRRYAGRPYLFPVEPEVSGFKPTVLGLFNRLTRLSTILVESIGSYLELREGLMTDMVRDSNSMFRILNYPDVAEDTVGVRSGKHWDINLITLLISGTASGLEVESRAGEGIPINNPPGAIIVNSGRMMELYTDGRLPATNHWVVNAPGRRMSAPFFVHARPNVVLAQRDTVRL
jgi:isopenicillin N synthase-like dioxygenase